MKVVSFDADPMNQKATVHPVMDLNAEPCALIRIESDVAGRIDILDGKSRKTETPADGITEHYVSYRERQITVKASGYLPARFKFPFELESGKVYILRVQGVGDDGRKIQRSAEVKLRYKPAPDEEIYGGVDGKVNAVDFSAGELTFRPGPGTHTIRLNSNGRVWEKRYDLKAGETIAETVEFTSEKIEQWDVDQPGGLYIESDPASATVLLDQVEQGVTPLTLENIQPGKYSLEIVKDLYLPESRTVEVKSLGFANIEVDLTPNFGRVNITSIPPGAEAAIDDQVRGETPIEIPRFNAGLHKLKLTKRLYYDETDNFEIKPGGEFVKEYRLRPQFGTVKLTSEPPGAEATVQGVSWGKTPLTRERVPSGDYTINYKLRNCFDEDQSISVADGETVIKSVKLRPSVGTLTVITDPPGATAVIAETNETLGRTPLIDKPVDRGNYTISITKKDYEPYERAAAITYGDEHRIETKLVRSSGHLQVISNPQKAKIYIDGKYRGETPEIVQNLPTGKREVRLDKAGYDIHVESVTVKRNEKIDFSVDLGAKGSKEWEKRRRNARLIAVIAPSGGQFYSGRYSKTQYVRGTIYGAAFIGGLALAYLAKADYEDYRSTYDAESGGYYAAGDQTEADDHFAAMTAAADDMQTAKDQANMFLYAAAGAYAVQLIDAWLWGGGSRPVVRNADAGRSSFYAKVENGSLTAGLRLNLGGGK